MNHNQGVIGVLNEDAANRAAVIRGTQLAPIHHLCRGWRNLHIQINKLPKQRLLDNRLALRIRPILVDCGLPQLPRTTAASPGTSACGILSKPGASGGGG